MLVSRQAATEQNPWAINKFETAFHKPADSLRMSTFDQVSQSDWHGQYSFLPPTDTTSLFSQSYEHVSSSADNTDSQAQPRTTAPASAPELDTLKQEPQSPLGHRLDPLGLRQPKQPSPIAEQAEDQAEQYAQKASESAQGESLGTTEASGGLSLGPSGISMPTATAQAPELPPISLINDTQSAIKEEDEDVLDDEDMVEVDGDQPTQAQTVAERTAQRRKMKRFR